MTSTEKLYDFFLQYRDITTDSRKVNSGSIFFALKGDNFDGNMYASKALEAGAALAVVDDPQIIPDNNTSRQYFLTDNVLTTLQKLAAYHRKKLGIPILAITGSNGKTTTKELIYRTLSKRFNTTVTRGNLNNHIGVPLTILSMADETQFGIVEMGANHCREIETLCKIACPDYGLITNIGKAHLEGFGGVEGIVRGKGEMFDYLATNNGTAFFLEESDILRQMAAKRKSMKAVPYSIRELDQTAGNDELQLSWNDSYTDNKAIHINTHLIGNYNLFNIAAAIAIGKYFKIAPHDIKDAIESYIPDNNRSQRQNTERNILILDAYNANPSSMQAAVENFAILKSDLPKTVILGDMLELGEYSHFEHMQIITLLQIKGIKNIYLVGKNFGDAAASVGALEPSTHIFNNVEQLNAYLQNNPLSGKTILIKGSRGTHLEKAVEFL